MRPDGQKLLKERAVRLPKKAAMLAISKRTSHNQIMSSIGAGSKLWTFTATAEGWK
jgi:hypothetical protein